MLIASSCQSDKWKEIEIISPDNKDTISIITIEDKRYIFNGGSDKIPKKNYALLNLRNVTELGDEIGICWDKDGFKWKLNSFYSELISNGLDTTNFYVQKKLLLDERGIPDNKEYFKKSCVVIYPRANIIRPNNGAVLKYK
tara:strand:+ start:81 stop:503 length:423 start_codon:yes stop_codon:yes gene_type:complete